MTLELREEETVADRQAISQVHWLGFTPGVNEANLVDQIRQLGLSVVSLMAVIGETIIGNNVVVGHALFSKVLIKTPQKILAGVALAPIAVWPNYQRNGIGSALIQKGLQLCRNRDYLFAVVLGDPVYYSRFGFSSSLGSQFRSQFSGKDFMALELAPQVLQDIAGEVIYPAPFQSVA